MKRTKLTPPMIARGWGTGVDKVHALIRSGALRAINLSLGTRKPRYLVDLADLAAFEQSRVVIPPPPPPSRPRKSDVPHYV